MEKTTFGMFVRDRRKERGISLRRLEEEIGGTFAYYARIERGELPPPSEDKIIKIAGMIGVHPDKLMTLAGRVPKEIMRTVKDRPEAMTSLIRAVSSWSDVEIMRLAKKASMCRNCNRESESGRR